MPPPKVDPNTRTAIKMELMPSSPQIRPISRPFAATAALARDDAMAKYRNTELIAPRSHDRQMSSRCL